MRALLYNEISIYIPKKLYDSTTLRFLRKNKERAPIQNYVLFTNDIYDEITILPYVS